MLNLAIATPPAPMVNLEQQRPGVWCAAWNPPKVERERVQPKDMERYRYWLEELSKKE